LNLTKTNLKSDTMLVHSQLFSDRADAKTPTVFARTTLIGVFMEVVID
jgi:hypothetical protein